MLTKAIQCIVGLGNPGTEYDGTRHNAGADFLKAFADSHQLQFKLDNKFHGLYARLQTADMNAHLLIPTTYMNNSGRAVRALAQFYKIEPEAILVVHDELDLPVGTVRMRQDGGHGGHNGLRDIITQLGTKSFYRLRIGIGHPGHKDKVTGYVLSKPSHEDQKHIEYAMDDALRIIPSVISGDIQNALKSLHTQQETVDGI